MTNYSDENMDSNDHPEDQLIQDYLKAPQEKVYDELRLHLAGCGHCRRRTEVTAMLREQGQWLESERVEADPRVADLLAGKLPPRQGSQLQQELKQDPASLRAALHYAAHAQAMSGITEPHQPNASWWSMCRTRITSWLNFQAPLWQTAPAIAVVMTVAVLVVNQYYPADKNAQAQIVAFQDKQMLRYASQEIRPGIGFFSQQAADAEPFEGMNIELLEGNRLRLSWPEIPMATGYNLKIQVFRDGETRVLARQSSTSAEVELLLEQALTQHRYEWVLSGDTSDSRSFQTNGGFVVTGK
jgi:hypothetical protein